MAVQTQIQTRRGTAATWTSTNPTLAAGEIGFESDTGKFKIGTGSTAWNSLAYSAGATAVTYLYNATSGQTTFSGTDANGLTLAYTVGAEQVFLNGVLQVRGTDYTATNGTSIVLASGALVSDVLNVIAYSAMTITDTYTQAQADAKFFQTANAFLAAKNKILNSDFGIWQRGTSFDATSFAGGLYTADRWSPYANGTGATRTISRQTFTPGTAPITGYEGTYFMRIDTSVAGSGNSYVAQNQRIEDVRTFAGQTVTYSFFAKASATATVTLGLSQQFGSGGSSAVDTVAGTSATLTTSWQRFSFTMTLPSISGKTIGTNSFLEAQLRLPANATFTIDIWGIQLEAGSIATPFQTATGTIQGELAACQRYYWRQNATGVYSRFSNAGTADSTTFVSVYINNPVPMRVVPTSFEYSNLTLYAGGFATLSSAALQSDSTQTMTQIGCTGSGITQYRAYNLLANNTTSSYVGLSAEL